MVLSLGCLETRWRLFLDAVLGPTQAAEPLSDIMTGHCYNCTGMLDEGAVHDQSAIAYEDIK